jgi:hypothetical protein
MSQEFAALLRHWDTISPSLLYDEWHCSYLTGSSDSVWPVLDVLSDPSISESVLLACVGSLKTWFKCHWLEISESEQRAIVERISVAVLIERRGFRHLLNAFFCIAGAPQFWDIWSGLVINCAPLLARNRVAGLAIMQRCARFFCSFPAGVSEIPNVIVEVASADRDLDPFSDGNATVIRLSIKAAMPLLIKEVVEQPGESFAPLWEELIAWCTFIVAFLRANERVEQPCHWRLLKSVGSLVGHAFVKFLHSETIAQATKQWREEIISLLMTVVVNVFQRQYDENVHPSVVTALLSPVARFAAPTLKMPAMEVFGWVHAFAAISRADQIEFDENPATYYATVFHPNDFTLIGLALRFAQTLCQNASDGVLFDVLRASPGTAQSARVLAQIAKGCQSDGLKHALFEWIWKFLRVCSSPREFASLFFLAAKVRDGFGDSMLAHALFSAAEQAIASAQSLVLTTTASKLLLVFPLVPELAVHLRALVPAVAESVSVHPIRLWTILMPHSREAPALCEILLPYCISAVAAELELPEPLTAFTAAGLDFCGAAVALIGEMDLSESLFSIVALSFKRGESAIEPAISLATDCVKRHSLLTGRYTELALEALPELMDCPCAVAGFFSAVIRLNSPHIAEACLTTRFFETFMGALEGMRGPDAVQVFALAMLMGMLLVADQTIRPDIRGIIWDLLGSEQTLGLLAGFNLLAAFCIHRALGLRDVELAEWVAFVRGKRICTEYDARVHCQALEKCGGEGAGLAAEMREDLSAFIGDPTEIFREDQVAVELIQLFR